MYNWRRMTPRQRAEAMALRRANEFPWHNPPHQDWGDHFYHFSAACYEHCPIIGVTPKRMADFEKHLLETIQEHCTEIVAWCVLPNHYHCLARTDRLETLVRSLGQLRGRLSYEWNGEERLRGRKVWHGGSDRAIRSQRHFWATANYVHYNPVRNGYVRLWQDWPFSSARDFVEKVGREEAARIWDAYPLLDYGKGWDEPEM